MTFVLNRQNKFGRNKINFSFNKILLVICKDDSNQLPRIRGIIQISLFLQSKKFGSFSIRIYNVYTETGKQCGHPFELTVAKAELNFGDRLEEEDRPLVD